MGKVKNIEKYKNEGPQTETTPEIENVCNQLSGEKLAFIISTIKWIHNNLNRNKSLEIKKEVFRKRTATEIISDGFTTGCTDITLVFIALCRAKGFPTKYVEAIDKKWLKGELQGPGIRGHVFAECFIEGDWLLIDPAEGLIFANPDHSDYYSNFATYKKGLDSWDLGIKSFSDLKQKCEKFKETFKDNTVRN